MDLVWVVPQLFADPRSGGDLRSLRLLQALTSRLQVSVAVVGHCDDPEALRIASGAVEVRVFPRPQNRAAIRARAWRHGWPVHAARMWTPEAAKWVAGFPNVLLDHAWVFPFASLVEGRRVRMLHNVEHVLLADRPQPRDPLRRWERRREIAATGELERMAVRRTEDLLIVTSGQDRALLGEGHVVPNGADIPESLPELDLDAPPLFVGSLDYEPNQLALEWWSSRVWPLLPEGSPALTVVGRGGAAALGRRAAGLGLNLVGEVPDVGPYLAAAGCVVVPLLHGGGSRLKVLEALAWGRPVVSTTKGVEGLPMEDGRDVLIADDPAAFARALQRLRAEVVLGRRLASEGRLLAAQYAWPAVGTAFADLVVAHLRA